MLFLLNKNKPNKTNLKCVPFFNHFDSRSTSEFHRVHLRKANGANNQKALMWSWFGRANIAFHMNVPVQTGNHRLFYHFMKLHRETVENSTSVKFPENFQLKFHAPMSENPWKLFEAMEIISSDFSHKLNIRTPIKTTYRKPRTLVDI